MRVSPLTLHGIAFVLLVFSASSAVSADNAPQAAINIPGGKGGVGFDDVSFSSQLGKVLIPAGQTNQIILIDPATRNVTAIKLSQPGKNYIGGHGVGTTSADEGGGFLFTVDRTAMTVNVIDPVKKVIAASAALASEPDYVRYVEATHEVWVTEPGHERIEIFTFSTDAKIVLKPAGMIAVPGGPESLVIDQVRQRAYTHLWRGATVVVDLKTRAIVEQWPNTCSSSHGIALDEEKGFLFVGCFEGKAVVLDLDHHGKLLGTLVIGPGVDVIGYNKRLSHLYLAGDQSAALSIVDISDEGVPGLLGVKATAGGSHCVTGDNNDGIWVCDPAHGRVLYFKDEFQQDYKI